MKILLATYWIIPQLGGVNVYINLLKRELEYLGHEVDILAHHPDMQKYHMVNQERFIEKSHIMKFLKVKLNAYYAQNLPKLNGRCRQLELERHGFELAAAYFGLSGYDIIHTHDVYSTRAMARVKRKSTPLVATIHGCITTELQHTGVFSDRNSEDWNYNSTLEYYGALSSDITIVPSQWLKNVLINQFHLPDGHIVVVPNGMHIRRFLHQMDKETNIQRPADKKVVFCPARLNLIKGHRYLLDALAKLKKVRQDWICWLAGDGEARGELESQCRQLGIEADVIFLGERDDVPALLKQADIFVLPSLQDNFPYAVMEAQIAGKPILITNAGGMPEMVQDDYTGLVSPLGEDESLYKNLARVLNDEKLRSRLAGNAKQWGVEHWTAERMIGATMDIYNSLIYQKKGELRGKS